MGLKDWLANSAGVGAYGDVMGREAVKNGLALGRVLYLGHGTRAIGSNVFVFKDEDHMRAEGFTLYCADPFHMPSAEDSSELSKQTRAAGVTLALRCSSNAAYNFMKKANADTFSRSMGHSIRIEMSEQDLDVTPDMLLRYNRLPRPAGITRIVEIKEPGTNDLLSVFLQEISRQNRTVGFRRTGALGFDVIAVPLAVETVKMVSAATQKFRW
jgi:hypothetical protein